MFFSQLLNQGRNWLGNQQSFTSPHSSCSLFPPSPRDRGAHAGESAAEKRCGRADKDREEGPEEDMWEDSNYCWWRWCCTGNSSWGPALKIISKIFLLLELSIELMVYWSQKPKTYTQQGSLFMLLKLLKNVHDVILLLRECIKRLSPKQPMPLAPTKQIRD